MYLDKKIKFTSVVIPVFNEQESIDELLQRTISACEKLECDYEIILVDDGSRDNSAQMLVDAANAEGSKVVALLLNRNYGQHSALMAGFEEAQGDLIVTLDADLQNPPEEIPRLVAAAEEGNDVVGTKRMNRQDTFFRRFSSGLINRGVQKATGVMMTDYGCMLRAYRRHIIEAMLQCHERSTFIPVLGNSFARQTKEIEVTHSERAHGESQYSFLGLINLMFDLVTSMTTAPLRLLSLVGGVIAGTGLFFGVLLLLFRLLFGAEWGGDGLFTLFAFLFMFIGAQFVGMGMLGEYIGRIYNDVRARPRYFVQQVVRAPNTQQSTSED
ncbi:undecaprenyl-phosphate 4-deoxy-4-formamido-L-arabinose transferase [Paraferrimonas sp. SM1919]|uniref:undecaprenyl-phosphate 4-deoxy-4-formamido-L-arabinose transferase n=1 Tax=Paraferrimonas sp. SM1919 TaxID=2662263 RepID=UPI0013D8288F|nr:undecaprenyl-phosphate 4-deoxy-4-formamido-L-arabinose transferase [Paraferrimonas sp. SM1919]